MMLALHECLALALFYHCFCRALKTNQHVRRDVLAAFWFLGIIDTVAIFAPITFGWRPDPMSLGLLSAILTVELVTSTHWRNGIPRAFIQEQKDSRHDSGRTGLA